MRIGVLGPLLVSDGGKSLALGGRKQRALLGLLVSRVGEVVSVDSMVDGIWGDGAPKAVTSSIQSYVSRLRSDTHLDIAWVGDGYRLNTDGSNVIDAEEFEDLVAHARLTMGEDPVAARAAIADAFTLWRGRPYGDLASVPALEPAVARLEGLRREAEQLKVDVNMALGDNAAAIKSIEMLLENDPYNEQLHAKQMIAQYREGRQAKALSLYQTVRRNLIEDLGVEPGPQLQRVEWQILVHDPTLSLEQATGEDSTIDRNPYKGAAAFEEVDAADFFGRDAEIVELVRLVDRHRLSLLVGPSGSGKSSLAGAGLLPALAGGAIPGSSAWSTAVIRPGTDPLGVLEKTLAEFGFGGSPRRLVVVDQFEECYSLVDHGDRTRFIEALIAAVDDESHDGGGLRVLITLRADFFHLPLMHAVLGPRLRTASMALSVPDAASLALAVECPAANVGLTVDPGVTAQLVADVEGELAALPLLQFTMTELAHSAERGCIDLDAYRRHGGVLGAIGHRAAATYDDLDSASQAACRVVFLNLVTVVEDSTEVRRRVHRSYLERLALPEENIVTVLNRFGAARLLTFDHDPTTGTATVEVSHEAVLHEWERLAGWIDEHRNSLLVRRRFQGSLVEWHEGGEADDLLPAGSRLAQFEDWASDADTVLSDDEQRFLGRAVDQRSTLEAARRRRRRLLTSGSLVVAVLSLALALLAWINYRTAERQTDVATARALISDAEQNIAVDPELAIMLAVEAIDRFADPAEAPSRATDVLRQALAANKVLGHIPGGWTVAADPVSGRLYTIGEEPNQVAIWDPATQAPLGSIDLPGGHDLYSVHAVGPDSLLVEAFDGRGQSTVIFGVELRWSNGALGDVAVVERLRVQLDDADWHTVAVSPRGDRVAVLPWFEELTPASARTTMQVWDLDGPQLMYTLDDMGSDSPAFSPDGRLLAVMRRPADPEATDGQIVVVDSTSGADSHVIRSPSFTAYNFGFSRDSTRLAYSDIGQVALADLRTEEEIWHQPDVSRVRTPVWSADGGTIFVGAEGTMSQLSADDGTLLGPILGDRGVVEDYTPVPGTEMLAIAEQTRVTLIDTSRHPRPELEGSKLEGTVSPIESAWNAVLDSTGRNILNSYWEHYVIQSVETGDVLINDEWWVAPNLWQLPVVSRNNEYFAAFTGGDDVLWKAADLTEVFRTPGDWSIRGVSDDANLVVLGKNGEKAHVVETETGRIVHELDVGPILMWARFTPDGRFLFTLNHEPAAPPYWRIWDLTSGSLVNALGTVPEDGALNFAMSSDGSRVILGRADGGILIYDGFKLVDGVDPVDALIRDIDAHDQLITWVSISPDDRLIATSAWDEPAKVWELDTGRKVGEFGGTGEVTSLAFHPTDPTVFVHDDGFVSVHSLDTEDLIVNAMATVTRPMADAECEQYLGGPCDSS